MASNLSDSMTQPSDVARLRFRPNGAAPCQPRATPWVSRFTKSQSPERATRIRSNGQSAAPSGLPAIQKNPQPRAMPRAMPWADLALPRWGEGNVALSLRDRTAGRAIELDCRLKRDRAFDVGTCSAFLSRSDRATLSEAARNGE